jgi:hypothetical protein
MNWLRQSYISRAVAIFFLLFTAADLMTPHLCSEELGLSSLSDLRLAGSINSQTENIATSIADANSHQEESSAPEQAHEDCFCCCSHILPEIHFVVAGVLLERLEADAAISSLPTGPPHKPYHPPRLS